MTIYDNNQSKNLVKLCCFEKLFYCEQDEKLKKNKNSGFLSDSIQELILGCLKFIKALTLTENYKTFSIIRYKESFT
jgi:hypothetical protein